MKKSIISLCLLSCILLCFVLCEKNARFNFNVGEGIIKNLNREKRLAELTITTTCISGRYYFKSNIHSPNEGGRPVIILDDGTEIIAIPFDVVGMEQITDARKGDIIEKRWEFQLPENFAPGEYTVRVLWNKSEETFEGVKFLMES